MTIRIWSTFSSIIRRNTNTLFRPNRVRIEYLNDTALHCLGDETEWLSKNSIVDTLSLLSLKHSRQGSLHRSLMTAPHYLSTHQLGEAGHWLSLRIWSSQCFGRWRFHDLSGKRPRDRSISQCRLRQSMTSGRCDRKWSCDVCRRDLWLKGDWSGLQRRHCGLDPAICFRVSDADISSESSQGSWHLQVDKLVTNTATLYSEQI